MSKSQFARVISLVNRDAQSVTAELVEGYRADLQVYLTSNNRTRLDDGVRSLIGKTAFLKKVRACIPPMDNLKGYSGAQSGAFEKQPAEVQAPFLALLESLTEAFSEALNVAGLFEKKEQTESQKAERAVKKAERAEADKKALKEAIIAEEGLVPASTIYGQGELVDAVVGMINAGTLDPENVDLLSEALAFSVMQARKALEAESVAWVLADDAKTKAEFKARKVKSSSKAKALDEALV